MALTLEMVIEELSNTCKELDIPFDHIKIRAGCSALIHGLRESTMDIDVDVMDDSSWDKLLLSQNIISRYESLNQMSGATVVSVGNIDFHWWNDSIDISNPNEVYHGFYVETLVELLETRIRLGRYKDLEDIVSLLPDYGKDLPVEVINILPTLISRIMGTVGTDMDDREQRDKIFEQLDFISKRFISLMPLIMSKSLNLSN